MRMRKKKHGEERILACAELLIEDPTSLMEDPRAPFSNKERELCLEIGCGKGNFAVGMAEKNPDCNFIAMERVRDVCCLALEKAMGAKDTRPDNLRFLIGDAQTLSDRFLPHSVERIYLNFSDPWPKARHDKRRLTYHKRLENYFQVMGEDGFVEFKTDNEGLFEFTLEEIQLLAEKGLEMAEMTRNLHGPDSQLESRQVTTEYEDKFRAAGKNINYVKIKRKSSL